MFRCVECGQFNNENATVCSACGAEIKIVDTGLIDELIAKAEKQFETDYEMNLDKSRVTYICSVCGEVNLLNNKACQKCGNTRPRSEFIKNLSKIKDGKAKKSDLVAEKAGEKDNLLKVEQDAKKIEEQKLLFKNMETLEEPIKLFKFVADDSTPEETEQLKKYVQPFIIVPYVDQGHPLLQYNPHELYRMDGGNINMEVAQPVPEQPKTVEQLKVLQYAKMMELKALENEIGVRENAFVPEMDKKVSKKNAKKNKSKN